MTTQPPPFSNLLLKGLRADELRRLRPDLAPVKLPMHKTVHAAGAALAHVYFVQTGMLSMVKPLSDGSSVEVGLVGREGCFGVPLLLGAKSSPIKVMVQAEGTALRMSAKRFLAHAEESAAFRKAGLTYAQVLHVQIEQTAACNIRHQAPQRLARWLLEAHDRIRNPELRLSHELLAMMLGSRRPGVTIALGKFQKAGILEIGHRRVILRDRAALEAAACECYASVKAETARLLRGR